MGNTSGEVGLRIILSLAYSLYPIGLLHIPSLVVDLLYHLCSSPALSYWQNCSLVHSSFPWTAWPRRVLSTRLSSLPAADGLVSRLPQVVSVTQAVFFPPYPSVNVFYVSINRLYFFFLPQRNPPHSFLSQKNLSCLWSVSSCHFWSLLNSLQ